MKVPEISNIVTQLMDSDSILRISKKDFPAFTVKILPHIVCLRKIKYNRKKALTRLQRIIRMPKRRLQKIF
jgi:hypothetical protein